MNAVIGGQRVSKHPLFRTLIAIGVAAGLMLGACGEPAPGPAAEPGIDAGGTGSPDDPVSSSPGDAGGIRPKPGKRTLIRPRPGMADLQPMQWDKATVSDDGRSVKLNFYIGVAPCYVLDHADVDYDPDKVTITLYQGHDPRDKNSVCIDIAMAAATIVELDEPLGDRKIVDGAA
jgi:hypothetical protein